MRVQPMFSTSFMPNFFWSGLPPSAVVRKTFAAHSSVVARTPDGATAAMLLWPEPTMKSAPIFLPSTGINAHGVGSVVEEGNAVLLGDLGYAADVVLIGELIVEVIDHDQPGQLSRLLA